MNGCVATPPLRLNYDFTKGRKNSLVSADSFKGRESDLRTLHRFVYSSGSPTHGSTPWSNDDRRGLATISAIATLSSTSAKNQGKGEIESVFSERRRNMYGGKPTLTAKSAKGNCGMRHIELIPLDLKEFKSDITLDAERLLRSSASAIRIYRTDLPIPGWSSLLLCAPRDHVLVTAPVSSQYAFGARISDGKNRALWTTRAMLETESARQFKADLRRAGLDEARIRWGALAYDGGYWHGGQPIGFSPKLQILPQYWFRSYLVPLDRVGECVGMLTQISNELGSNFCRPSSDSLVAKVPHADGIISVNFGSFEEIVFERSNGAFEKEDLLVEAENAVSNALGMAAKGVFPAIEKLHPFFHGALLVDFGRPRDYRNPGDERLRVDEVYMKRLRLANLLAWPCFLPSFQNQYSAIQVAAKWSPQLLQDGSVLRDVEGYLSRIAKEFPAFGASLFDEVWADR